MKKVILFSLLLFANKVNAATYWVDPSESAVHCVNSASDPGAGSRSKTITQGISCLSAGDTLIIKAGTYSETGASIPTGTISSPITIKRNGSDVVTVGPNNPFNFYSLSVSYITIDGLVINGTGAPANYDGFDLGNSTHHITIQNSEIKNWTGMGIQIEPSSHDNILRNNLVHDNGDNPTQEHGLYIHGPSNIMEYNKIYSNCAYGVQVYSQGGTANSNVIRFNEIYSNDACAGFAGGAVLAGTSNLFYGNIVRANPTFGLDVYSGSSNVVYNNTFYSNIGYGVIVEAGSSSAIIKNNIFRSNSQDGVSNGGTGTTISNNLCDATCPNGTSNQAGDPLFVNPASANFSLAVSSPAIDNGTAAITTGITACANGSAPDIGAVETLGTPTATVNGANAVITIPNNCTSQMLPASSVTGWTFKKNGSGDTVTANSLSGTNSYAATLTSAFIGGDTCLFSYSQSGNSTSNNSIGGATTNDQEVLAFTDAACTNITSGGGPTLAYTHGRWYLLQGATDTAWVAKGAADANVTVAPGSKLNLRWKVKNTGADTSLNPRIRVSYDGGSYVELTSSYVNAVKALGSAPQLGTVMTDASPMTQDQLTSDVANIACTYIRNPVSAPNLALTTNTESECGAAIDFDTTAVAGKQYDFKLYDDVGTAISGGPISVIIGGYSSVR